MTGFPFTSMDALVLKKRMEFIIVNAPDFNGLSMTTSLSRFLHSASTTSKSVSIRHFEFERMSPTSQEISLDDGYITFERARFPCYYFLDDEVGQCCGFSNEVSAQVPTCWIEQKLQFLGLRGCSMCGTGLSSRCSPIVRFLSDKVSSALPTRLILKAYR